MDSLQDIVECWPFEAVVERIHGSVVLPPKNLRELAAGIERFGSREASIGYRVIASENPRHLENTCQDVANHYFVGEQRSDRRLPQQRPDIVKLAPDIRKPVQGCASGWIHNEVVDAQELFDQCAPWVQLNRPGFRAHLFLREGWHDAKQIRSAGQGQGGPVGSGP